MPWMPGTTIVGLQSSAAKSVRARTRKPTIASVQRIERTERPPEGLGGGRYAHAAVGKPQRGQKWPRNTVPQRGHGHPGAAAIAAGGAVAGAGVPHRGQNDPSNVANLYIGWVGCAALRARRRLPSRSEESEWNTKTEAGATWTWSSRRLRPRRSTSGATISSSSRGG